MFLEFDDSSCYVLVRVSIYSVRKYYNITWARADARCCLMISFLLACSSCNHVNISSLPEASNSIALSPILSANNELITSCMYIITTEQTLISTIMLQDFWAIAGMCKCICPTAILQSYPLLKRADKFNLLIWSLATQVPHYKFLKSRLA